MIIAITILKNPRIPAVNNRKSLSIAGEAAVGPTY
jgi:hypothetical protein